MDSNRLKLFLLVFFVGSGMKFDINLGVRIPLGELLAFASLPFIVKSARLNNYSSRLNPVLAVLGVWALGILVSDALNVVAFDSFIKGLAKPAWCGLWMLFFIAILDSDYRALYVFPAGLIIAGLQNYFFPQAWTSYYLDTEYGAAAFALVPLVLPAISCVALYLYGKFPLLSPIAYLVGGVSLALLGVPRNMAAICLLIALILVYIRYLKNRRIRVQKIPLGKIILFGILSMVMVFTIFKAYVWSASNGFLGEHQREKLEDQSNTIFGNNPLGLLLGGRTEVFAAILAIIDQPLTGYGSWQGRTLKEYYLEAVIIVGTDPDEYQMLVEYGSPGVGHSIIFSLWAENGLLAAISLGIIAFWVLKEILNIVFKNNPFAPLFISMAIFFAWSFLFSPFAIDARLAIGMFLALRVTRFCEWPPGAYYSDLLRSNRRVIRVQRVPRGQLLANGTEHCQVQNNGHHQSYKHQGSH